MRVHEVEPRICTSEDTLFRPSCMKPTYTCQPTAGPTDALVDISPLDFVRLVLPVYKAMFAHMPTSSMVRSMMSETLGNAALRSVQMVKHYTSVSFARLLGSARRTLRVSAAHFEAALEAIIRNSGLILAPNLQQEQVSATIPTPAIRLRKQRSVEICRVTPAFAFHVSRPCPPRNLQIQVQPPFLLSS